MSDNITPTNTYTPSTYTSDDFTATNNNTVTITPSEEASAAPSAPPQPYDKDIVVNHGDTLSSLLLSQNIQTQDVLAILALPLVQHSLVRIHPGQIFTIHVDANQSLTSLTYDISAAQTLSVIKQNDSFDAKITKKPTKVLPTIAAGVITSTFYDAGLAQHLPQKIILDASRIFASKINFKRGLQPGDHFKVIYESSYVGNKAIGTGNILAMQISSGGKTYTLIRHTGHDGISRYYTTDGATLVHSAFLRSPVHYTRISSPFSLNRVHPLLLFSRPHYGVDLAAPRGSPVIASGNGVVTVAGREGGYGNLIIIDHGHGITTRYGHLNGFARNIHPGSYVKQGQLIAYVGSTGLATGPHLHYEFRINNVPQNPMSVKLPMADPLSTAERAQFNREVKHYVSEMQSTPLNMLAHAPGLPQNADNDEDA